MTVEVGDRAPDFELADQHGAPVTLAELRERAGALVVFYPFAFSRICGSELRELQRELPALRASASGRGEPSGISDIDDDAGLAVVAISTDPMHALRAYSDDEGITFPLLSDFWPHGAVARSYGVFHEERGCALRGSFLVDASGVVRWRVVNGLGEPRDVAAYSAAVAGL
jgi:peroxiredoxin